MQTLNVDLSVSSALVRGDDLLWARFQQEILQRLMI